MTEIETLQTVVEEMLNYDDTRKLSSAAIGWLRQDVRENRAAYEDFSLIQELPETRPFFSELEMMGILPDYDTIAGRRFTGQLLSIGYNRTSKLLGELGVQPTTKQDIQAKTLKLRTKQFELKQSILGIAYNPDKPKLKD